MDKRYEIVGAVHLHSDYSDGSLPIPEIAQQAEEKGLDFLMFSDHNTLEPKREGLEGWYGSVLVMIGCELNDPDDRNHYLAFRIDKEIETGLEAAQYVHRVRTAGGFGVIAHPAEKREFHDAYPPYPWTAWDVDEFDGIEIWNQLSEWMEGVTKRNFLWRILHPLRSIRYPVWETLERWDKLNLKRRVVGLGGIDVHGHKVKLFGFIPVEIYPYKVQFRSIRMHLLTKNHHSSNGDRPPFQQAEDNVFESLIAGRCFISNFRVGDARSFQFLGLSENHKLEMGDRIQLEETVHFRSTAPLTGTIRLVKDGREVKRVEGRILEYDADAPGVYRVEVFRMKRGWIYSNPIVLLNS